MTDKDELAALKARVAELERAKTEAAAPPPYDPIEAERSTRKWMSEMHQMDNTTPSASCQKADSCTAAICDNRYCRY